jgi:hypothetical protein
VRPHKPAVSPEFSRERRDKGGGDRSFDARPTPLQAKELSRTLEWIRDWFFKPVRTVRRAAKPSRPKRVRPRLEALEDRTAPAVFNVSSPADDGGVKELRWAIHQVNASNDATNTINFHIGAAGSLQRIAIGSDLTITKPVTINGLSQGLGLGPLIEVDGSLSFGFVVNAGGVTIADLAVFNGDGIDVNNPAGSAGDQMLSCYIGTDATGQLAGSGNTHGVLIGGADNTVAGCLISGNIFGGVELSGAGAVRNVVRACTIGLDRTGLTALPNGTAGVRIDNGANFNTIGAGAGATVNPSNYIAGNRNCGVVISDASSNLVEGNAIGLGVDDATQIANQGDGVLIESGATNNTIGGTFGGATNLISGNTGNGVHLTDTNVAGNVISGDFIGVALDGATVKANGNDSVLIEAGAFNNTVGGLNTLNPDGTFKALAAGNVISGNSAVGVEISGAGTKQNLVEGDFIGTDSKGMKDVGNDGQGVELDSGAANNTIGGLQGGTTENVISSNGHGVGKALGYGVYLKDQGTNNNVIEGNLIGTDITGNAGLGNVGDGVFITSLAANNTVGGAAAGAGNVISDNGDWGVEIASTNNNLIQANVIGMQNTDHTKPLPNKSGAKKDPNNSGTWTGNVYQP